VFVSLQNLLKNDKKEKPGMFNIEIAAKLELWPEQIVGIA